MPRKPDFSGLSPEIQALIAEAMEKQEKEQSNESKIREANAVLQSLYQPKSLITRECPECGEKFQTNYMYSRFCTKTCLKAALLKRGLTWNPEKPDEERWGGEPPSQIVPATLKVLVAWARNLLAQIDETQLSENTDQDTSFVQPGPLTESKDTPSPSQYEQESSDIDQWLAELDAI